MKIFYFFILTINLYAQGLSLGQSSPELSWKRKNTTTGEIIFSNKSEITSENIENYLNYYSNYVGHEYHATKPKPFTLILRPELAQPNGFVTLGPRRSEWFEFGAVFPFATTLNWFQVLAIHEYRHVVQFDYFHQSTAKLFNILFGDFGKQIALFVGVRPWFMEGDAVWAETKYTDSGRGRSPRFLSRLKALVLSGQIPTYDQFIGQSLKTNLPNWYVYGYVLVAYGRKKYGDDFWKKVLDSVTVFPNPFRLYSQFEKHAGIPFSQFYNETMNDLKNQWANDFTSEQVSTYQESIFPMKLNNELYYLNTNLDQYWELRKINKDGGEEKIAEIPFHRDMMTPSLGHKYFVFSQFLMDERYSYKNYSEIFVLNLETKKLKQITDGKRYFNPKLSKSMEKMLVVEFDSNQKWNLIELNMLGVELRKISLEDRIIQQADYLNDNEIIAIISLKDGHKQIEILDLDGGSKKVVLPATKMNIFHLDSNQKNKFVFEGQVDGRDEIFLGDLEQKNFKRCTQSKIGAYYASIVGEEIHYSKQTINGLELATTNIAECGKIDSAIFENFNYLSKNNPSDNLIAVSQLAPITNKTSSSDISDYSDFEKRGWTPHSWSLVGGRGFLTSFQADNYLGTTSLAFELGQDPEEEKNYGNITYIYQKYRTILALGFEDRTRKIEYFNSTDSREWKEYSSEFSVIYPYIYSKNLIDIQALLQIDLGHLSTKDYEYNQVKKERSKDYFESSASFEFSIEKSLTQRSIYSPWHLSFKLKNDHVEGAKELVSRNYHHGQIHFPSYWKHHLFKLTYDKERQSKDNNDYRFLPEAVEENQYVFSRGYDYESVAQYEKFTANYIFPLALPDYNIEKWLFVRRIFANLFYDTTKISQNELVSYGLELEMESTFFRVLPLNWGFRIYEKEKTDESDKLESDIYLTLSTNF